MYFILNMKFNTMRIALKFVVIVLIVIVSLIVTFLVISYTHRILFWSLIFPLSFWSLFFLFYALYKIVILYNDPPIHLTKEVIQRDKEYFDFLRKWNKNKNQTNKYQE
jgi:hypothetical protein